MSKVQKTEARLAELAALWLEAKKRERLANKERTDLESEILKITGSREEGSQTTNITGFKVVVTGKVTRKMDWEKWEEVKNLIPPEWHPVKQRSELDEAGVKWLFDNEKDSYNVLPLTITPAKTAVSVVAIPEDAK